MSTVKLNLYKGTWDKEISSLCGASSIEEAADILGAGETDPKSISDLGSKVEVYAQSIEPTLQEKETTTNGEVTPDEGYDGLSKVTVNVPATVVIPHFEQVNEHKTTYLDSLIMNSSTLLQTVLKVGYTDELLSNSVVVFVMAIQPNDTNIRYTITDSNLPVFIDHLMCDDGTGTPRKCMLVGNPFLAGIPGYEDNGHDIFFMGFHSGGGEGATYSFIYVPTDSSITSASKLGCVRLNNEIINLSNNFSDGTFRYVNGYLCELRDKE